MARHDGYIFVEESHRGRSFLIGLLVVLGLIAAGLFTWNLVSNNTVVYTKEYVTISHIPNDLENWTILHLSDLNGADLGSGQSAVRTAIGTRSYSCVVMSGNMVGKSGDIQPLLDLIGILPKGTPILLLPGDSDPPLWATTAHSSLSPYADWAVQLQSAGVTVLDEPIAFVLDGEVIWFVPESLYSLDIASAKRAYQDTVDYLDALVENLTPDQDAARRHAEYQVERLGRIEEKIASMKEAHIQIAVTHMPMTREGMTKARANPRHKVFNMNNVSLVLAGGYCGGQWRIPGVGALYVPELGFLPEDSQIQGMGYLAGAWQHISLGLGPSSEYPFMPFRLFNHPGATLLVLTADVH